jgi:hypothetical protein
MDTHTIASLFGESIYQTEGIDFPDRVRIECVNVCKVLTSAAERGISPSELYYYYRGHNQGYTKAMSI